jgi:hypothetical protein
MEPLRIWGTEDIPNITLDNESGVFEITGRSLPEDVAKFYEPILTWLDEYAKAPKEKTDFIFKLTYFNTATSKLLMDVLVKLENLFGAGHNVKVFWYAEEFDEDIIDQGVEFRDNLSLPFEIIKY